MAASISLRLTFAERKEKISLSQILTKYPKNCSAYFFLSQKVNFKISENFCLLLLSINSAPTFIQSEFPRNFPYEFPCTCFLGLKTTSPSYINYFWQSSSSSQSPDNFYHLDNFFDLPSSHAASRDTLCSWNIQMLSLTLFSFPVNSHSPLNKHSETFRCNVRNILIHEFSFNTMSDRDEFRTVVL